MKRKDIFRAIISTIQLELPFPVINRELELPVDSGQMITVAGVRRCGKSSLMKIVANKLFSCGVPRERILWVNFDDERLVGLQAEDLDELLQAYREMFPDTELSSVYMFFDEIQNIPHWELFVMRVYKTYCKNLYISGSNAKMLSSQLATALRGWPIEFEAYPLSFSEYMNFKREEVSGFEEAGRAKLINYCREYLHDSAFPEIVLMNEPSLKIRKVQGYFNTMLFRDLLEHYNLSNPEMIRYFLKRLLLNLSKPTSINSIYNDLKSQGRKVDKNRLYELADMVCDVFMFFKVPRWSGSFIKESNRLPKYYFIDNGMRNSILQPQSDDDGKLLENAVFINLQRYGNSMTKISYFMEECECDFVVQQNDEIIHLIQVSWTINDVETRARELRGLKVAASVTGCNNCSIVTFDDEESIEYDGLNINVVPAWKWLAVNPY